MTFPRKILEIGQLGAWAQKAREKNLAVVHCHGVFDLLHPGHIEHLEEAKSLGSLLCVTVTADDQVNKGPGRPMLCAEDRARMLAALEIVDVVSISRETNGVLAIKNLRADFFVKGPDYSNPESDPTGNIQKEINAVEESGGKLHITRGDTMSSSKLRNDIYLAKGDELSEFLQRLRQVTSQNELDLLFARILDLKVLVVGEAIIDNYISCEALGKSSKDPVLAFKPLSTESHLGGSLAIARHVAGLGAKTTLLTRVGKDRKTSLRIQAEIGGLIDLMLVESEDEPTIEKTRFLDSLTGNKVFETYQIGESVASKADSEELLTNLRSVIGDFDLVLVADYGHGLLDSGVISELSSHARLLSVNTQSNAGNRGFNTISKYPRLDVVVLNGAEVALELREKHLRMEVLVPELLERTQAKFVGVTMGAKGLIYGVKGETGIAVETVPAFSTVVKDRVGAGDALFAVTSVALAAEASPLVASLLGNLAGAASIAELGNRVTIDRTSLLRHASATLK